jgi:hypothetical protein
MERVGVGGAGNPSVAWVRTTQAGADEVYLRRWNGSAWEELAGSGSDAGISNSATFSSHVDVAVDVSGNPVLAWSEGSGTVPYEIYVRRWSGSSWIELEGSGTGGGISASPANSQFPTLGVTPQGDILVAWTESNPGDSEIWMRGRFGARVTGADQFKINLVTPLPVGGVMQTLGMWIQGTVSSSVYPNSLRIEVEIRQVGTDFTGLATHVSGYAAPGIVRTVAVNDLPFGDMHWRIRAASTAGVVSPWISFGENPESQADFIVPGATSSSPGSSGGSGGGGGMGCGLTGLEAVLLILSLRAGLRKVRRRTLA